MSGRFCVGVAMPHEEERAEGPRLPLPSACPEARGLGMGDAGMGAWAHVVLAAAAAQQHIPSMGECLPGARPARYF